MKELTHLFMSSNWMVGVLVVCINVLPFVVLLQFMNHLLSGGPWLSAVCSVNCRRRCFCLAAFAFLLLASPIGAVPSAWSHGIAIDVRTIFFVALIQVLGAAGALFFYAAAFVAYGSFPVTRNSMDSWCWGGLRVLFSIVAIAGSVQLVIIAYVFVLCLR